MTSEHDLTPNFTQFPNKLMDYVIPLLRESEEKVLIYVLRCTYGYRDREGHQKEQDYISYSQFIGGQVSREGKIMNFGAGVSRPRIAEALAFHQATGLIERLDPAAGKRNAGRGSTGLYRLNRHCEMVTFLNQCLQDPDTAREKMVQYCNQKRLMVKKLNHSFSKPNKGKPSVSNGYESEPLKNGYESEPEMVTKVNTPYKEKERNTKTDTLLSKPDETPVFDVSVDDMIESWNDICGSEGLPKVSARGAKNETLRKKIKLRLKENPEMEFWETVLNACWKSPFLKGEKGGWKVTLGWLVENDRNALKVYEGNYNGQVQ